MTKPAPPEALYAAVLERIGILHTPHTLADQPPVQPVYDRGCPSRAAILPPYRRGLRNLEGFSHVILVFGFHLAEPAQWVAQPFTGDHPCGVFATRHPRRPNPIGLGLGRLDRMENGVLHLLDLDMLDNTPLLDSQPFVPRFDQVADARGGGTETVADAVARQRG